jgi:hypothetical protein
MTVPGIGGRPKWQPTPQQRARVRQLRARGHALKAIARKLGVSHEAVRRECHQELGLSPVATLPLYDRAAAGDVGAAIKWLRRNGDVDPVTARALFEQLAPPPPSRRA